MKNFDNHFYTIPERPGQTDRQTDLRYQYRALYSWMNADTL